MVTCTGMLTIPMAKAGYIVDSIDASEEVQDIAIEKLNCWIHLLVKILHFIVVMFLNLRRKINTVQ